MKHSRATNMIITIQAFLFLLVLWNVSPGQLAAQETNEPGGGIIIIRNCPKNEITNFNYMPSSTAGAGWAEVISGDQTFRLEFDSFTDDDLEEFNRLGNAIEPQITVMMYYGDFVFFVKSRKESIEKDPKIEKQPINLFNGAVFRI